MLFSSQFFLVFFLPVVLGVHALLSRGWRNAFLTLASLGFYAWGEQEIVLVMVLSIAANHFFGGRIDRLLAEGRAGAAKGWVALAVAFNLGLLVLFKYARFLAESANALARGLGGLEQDPFALPEIHLPIGISFFTFQALSYVVDVYRRDAQAQKSPVDFGLYIALFPQLIAGPIVRYRDIAEQLGSRIVDARGLAEGARRFIIGLGKKVLIANTVAQAVDGIFEGVPPSELTAPLAWLALGGFAVQIYFDFSGYSDMAIGLARMFGLRLRENFNYPHLSLSITEFWRRWHISLGSWFRDYLYVPLGGNRRGPWRTYFNLFVVFFLCGLWHGAAWTFVGFGLHHGAFMILERLGLGRALERLPRFGRRIYFVLVLLMGWSYFRAVNLEQAFDMIAALVGFGGGDGVAYNATLFLSGDVVVTLVLGIVGSLPLLHRLARALGARGGPASELVEGCRPPLVMGRGLGLATDLLLLGVLVLCHFALAAATSQPFIYFRF